MKDVYQTGIDLFNKLKGEQHELTTRSSSLGYK